MSAGAPIRAGAAWALVPARGGSKGIPSKNLRRIGGHPLVAWAVAAGRAAHGVERVVCSTDDAEIAEAAGCAGAEVPFRRPPTCASDLSTDIQVFSHALSWFADAEGAWPEFFVHLRPTAPFRDPDWIDAALERMRDDPTITCLRSVAPSPLSPYKMWQRDRDGRLVPAMNVEGLAEAYNMPRQALPEVLWHTGQVDVIRTDTLCAGSMTGDEIRALDVPLETAVDIDAPVDLALAEIQFEALMPARLRYLLDV